ncbi:ATP-binding protein [Sphaerisporangium sp. NPDC051011]|uniref:ATP-binding protein n=1 Tax=Sphaerisporangium sp. NPDC051011 TaxID=3155792 RepID=UPI0033CB5989
MNFHAPHGESRTPHQDPCPDLRTRRMESATFPAAGPSVREARRWLSKILDGHPRHDDAVLLLSEAVTNSLVHTGSATFGVTVAIMRTGDVRIEVADEGGPTIPSIPPHPDDDPADSGRGIRLIRTLSTNWGFTESRPHCVLWFVLSAYLALPDITPVMASQALTCMSANHEHRQDLRDDGSIARSDAEYEEGGEENGLQSDTRRGVVGCHASSARSLAQECRPGGRARARDL